MPTTDAEANTSGPVTNGEVTTGCSVCPHPMATHDPIAARYCVATAVGSYSRGCVCSGRAYDKND